MDRAPSTETPVRPETRSVQTAPKTGATEISPARATANGSAASATAWSEAAWHELLAQPATAARNASLAALLESLASTDPAEALALAQGENNRVLRDRLLQAALHGWARIAPTDAIKWIATSVHPLEREEAFNSVFAGAVATDPAAAMRMAKTLIQENPGDALAYGGYVVDALCQAGYFELAAKMAASGDDNQRAGWVGNAYSKWTMLQPEAAARAALAIEDPALRKQALHGVTGGWSDADPAALVQFVNQLPEEDDKASLLSQGLHRWTKVDLKAASDWINHHELGAAMDEGVASIATQDYLKPDVAISWAESVTNPKLRSETLVSVLRSWATVDLPAAKRYLEASTNLTPEDRQEMAGVIATLSGQPAPADPAATTP